MTYRRPTIPAGVERQLRQEAGFGCVKCGHPYLEYHHIVPWSEEQHFRPEDMVAVCGNCHGFFETQGRGRQYRLKENPKNVAEDNFNGLLAYDKRDLVFRVGSNWYENVPTILQYRNVPLISCRLESDQAQVSLNIMNSNGRLVIKVVDNVVTFRLGSLWDFECRKNVAIARSDPRSIALRFDFSQPDATIEGQLWAGDRLVELSRDRTNISASVFKDNRIVNSRIGIQIG